MGGEKVKTPLLFNLKERKFEEVYLKSMLFEALSLEIDGDLEEAFEHYLDVATRCEREGDLLGAAVAYAGAAECARELGSIDKSKELYRKAAKLILILAQSNGRPPDRVAKLLRRAALYFMYGEDYLMAERALAAARLLEGGHVEGSADH